MKKYFSLLILTVSLFAPAVFASKVDVVRSVLKQECKKTVSYEEALVYVRVLYLTCIPETTVHIADFCSLKCLKDKSGAAVVR
jgi:hypothetical protein